MSKIQIQWEDENSDFESDKVNDDDSEFTQLLLDNKDPVQSQSLRIGARVKAKVSYISSKSDDILLDLGGKAAAVIAKNELTDEQGQLTYQVGDEISAFIVAKKDGNIVLSNSMSHQAAKEFAIEQAHEAKIPVKGKVTGVNPGGFEITLLGKTAFCPISQIDTSFVSDEQKASYLGKEFEFLVQNPSKRNIIVSRSALLKRKVFENLDKIKEQAEKGIVVSGSVKELKDFGAMIDLDGIVGMLHISEISYARVDKISEVLSVGDRVRVKILSIEEKRDSFPRISLSMKQVESDPWKDVTEKIKIGESYSGKVVRLTDFGAFVEIEPGLDGLIHLSQMSWTKRVHAASDVLSLKEKVTVRVLEIDPEKKRISLTLKTLDADPWLNIDKHITVGQVLDAFVESLKPVGAFLTIAEGISGYLPISSLKKAFSDAYRKKASPDQSLKVKIASINKDERKILLALPELDSDDDAKQDFAQYLAQESKKVSQKVEAKGSFGELLSLSLDKKQKK